MAEREIKNGIKFTTNFFVSRGDGTYKYEEVKSNLPNLLGEHEIGQGAGSVEITLLQVPPRLNIKGSLYEGKEVDLRLPKRNGHDEVKLLHVSPQGRTIVEFSWSEVEDELKPKNS